MAAKYAIKEPIVENSFEESSEGKQGRRAKQQAHPSWADYKDLACYPLEAQPEKMIKPPMIVREDPNEEGKREEIPEQMPQNAPREPHDSRELRQNLMPA